MLEILKKWLTISAALSIAFFVIASIVITARTAISISRDIDSPYLRAQVAATPESMISYLEQTLDALDNKGMDGGYTSIWVKSPWTDMETIRANVGRIIQRLEIIQTLPPESDAYQQGLDDCRGIIRELKIQAFGFWTVNQSGWLWLLCIPIALVAFIPVAIIYAILDKIEEWSSNKEERKRREKWGRK